MASAARRVFAWAIVVAAAVYLYVTISRNWRELTTFEWQVAPLLLTLSLASHVAVLAWGVHIWGRVLRCMDAPVVSYAHLLRIWSASNLTKYIPGAVWQFMTAAHLSRGQGLPAVVTMSSMLIHVGFSLLTSISVAAVTLPFDARLGVLGHPASRIVLVALTLLAIHPRAINGALRLVPRSFARELLDWKGSWLDGLAIYMLSVLTWVMYGVAFSLFVASLAEIPLAAAIPLTAVNALSFTAGYVAIIAPGGLGVRESAMTLLLTPLLPAGVAALLAIGARLWSVVSELALTAVGVLAVRSDR